MSWPEVHVGDLMSLEYGRPLPRATRVSTGTVPVAGSNGSDGRHDTALVDGPGIVVGRKGSAGKVTWFDSPFWPIDTTYFVKHDPDVTNLRWLYYLLRQTGLERLNKTTGVPGLNRADAYAERCLLPPPSEQHRIVEILDQADALRKLRHDADAKAARILPALFLKMFGDPQRNPFGLEKKPLGELIRVKSGRFLSAKNMTETGPFPVYGGNGVNGHHNEYMFEERKIVLGRVGAYCGAVHYTEPRSWITDNALYVTEKLKPLIDRYLVVALTQANLNQYAGRAGQPLISGTRIYPVEILRPSEDAQVEFARIAEAVIQLHSDLSDASAQLESLWKRLMQRAFSGQLTAKWREAHMQELLVEMQEQARLLNLPAPN